jgi:hypothetical protein
VSVTNQSCIHKEVKKKRLNLGNAWYRSVQSLFSSRLLSKDLQLKIYKIIILPVILYGCETWFLILKEKQRLRGYENRVLRRVFRHKREEVVGGWRRLHNVELHNFCASPDIIRTFNSSRMTWSGHVARMRETKNACRILIRKCERKDHSEGLGIDGRIIL